MKDLVLRTESFDFVRHLIAFMKVDAEGIRTVRLCNNEGDLRVLREISKRTLPSISAWASCNRAKNVLRKVVLSQHLRFYHIRAFNRRPQYVGLGSIFRSSVLRSDGTQ